MLMVRSEITVDMVVCVFKSRGVGMLPCWRLLDLLVCWTAVL